MLAGLFLHGLAHHSADIGIALVGDDALGVIVQFPLAVCNVLFQMIQQFPVQLQLCAHHFIPLKELDGIPAQIIALHRALDGFLNVGQGVLHAAAEHMGHIPMGVVFGQSHGLFRCFKDALALQRADLHAGAAQGAAELFQINGVAVLAHQVDHVHRHHHGVTQFNELGGEIEVALNVGAVHDVQNGIGMLVDQIGAGHHFLRRVGRKGIDTGQILDHHILVPLELAFLFFHSHAGPVAHVLVGAGQRIEQRGLAAVRVAGQCDLDHRSFLQRLAFANRNFESQRLQPSQSRFIHYI